MANRTKIPWCDYTINPVRGLCPMACKDKDGQEYCYARRMYKRFRWNPEIRFNIEGWAMPLVTLEPSLIFVGSTMELFGEWVKPEWIRNILATPKSFPRHTFIFLTKQPQNLPKELPDNCWVGISATSHNELADRWGIMRQVNASVKFVSLEPLLNWADTSHRPIYSEGIINSGIQWIIIGCQTPMSAKTLPKIEWVDEIIKAADKAKIPVFIKPPLSDIMNLHRQEFPKP